MFILSRAKEQEKTMDILMTILKIIFVLMLCVPVFMIARYLVTHLIDEFIRQQKRKKDSRQDLRR